MLNVEKIRLMTQLSIYDRKEGKAIRDVSRYFKGDYLSRRMFMALVHYTLCFILVSMLLMLINIEELLMHLNIPFIVAAVRVLLFIYVLGFVGMMAFSYVRYARAYDDLHRKSLYYMAKLDKLLQIEEAPDTKLDIESAGSEFYKEKGGKIRVMEDAPLRQTKRSKTAPDRRGNASAAPKQVEAQPVKRKSAVQDTDRQEEAWLDDPIEPENGWLDDPVEPGDGWLDDGNDTVTTGDDGDWLDDPVDPKPHSDTGRASMDGIQLMDFRKHHEGR